jgi:hypothetical protein
MQMSADPPDKMNLDRVAALHQKRREILALPPEEALERILDDPHPAALVHAIPEPDFYFLVHDIGPEDALPLLALASDKQWDHLVDLEGWAKDRIEVNGVTRWLDLLLEADSKRFMRWFLQSRLEFVEFYLFNNIEVRVREHDQDPSDFGDDFFSLDGTYYVRFLGLPPVLEDSAIHDETRKAFLSRFIERLAAFDHQTFLSVLLEATHVIPAEAEERELHWRNVRLAEMGFLPFDEAVGVYQPLKPQDVKARGPKFPERADGEFSHLPVPAYPLRELEADTHLGRALARVAPGQALDRIQWEFANLCNQVIVADHRTVRDREQLRQIVRKACGYIGIGLERLSGGPGGGVDPGQAAAELTRLPLVQIFRLGFGAALEIKWKAERWLNTCWFAKAGLRLTFWGEQWMGVLGGLLLKKPLYYDNYASGVLYREFESAQDVAATAAMFERIQAVDDLLSLLAIPLNPPGRYGFLTYKNLLLTGWAARRLGLRAEALAPIPLPAFRPFFAELLPAGAPADAAAPRRVPEALKTAFIDWLAAETGLKDFEISGRLGPVFEDLFGEIEAEYGRVAAKDLDPRFVQLFLLEKD